MKRLMTHKTLSWKFFMRKHSQLAGHRSGLKMCHRSIPHVLCPIYFASVSQLLQLQRQQEMPLLLRNFATKRIGPYIKPVCDFHHLLSTQSAWRYQNWLNSMTQKCTKKIHPFELLLTFANFWQMTTIRLSLARCVRLWRQWLSTLQRGGKTSRENHFDSQSSKYCEVLQVQCVRTV